MTRKAATPARPIYTPADTALPSHHAHHGAAALRPWVVKYLVKASSSSPRSTRRQVPRLAYDRGVENIPRSFGVSVVTAMSFQELPYAYET